MSYFNQHAQNWDSLEKVTMMQHLAQESIAALGLKKGDKLDLLDFGCGTGLFSLELADYTKRLIGMDTSEEMLKIFDQKTMGDQQIESIKLDLEEESHEGHYDLIVSSMTFHHLKRPELVLPKLKAMLKAHGRIVIIDLDQEDGSFHPENHQMGVKHFGFTKSDLAIWCQEVGFTLSHQIIHQITKHGREYGVFMAIMTLTELE
ncbi:MAG: methyltransferase domain-containing protein [Bdellovibrionales bacterium]|jgi:2-polyprenyl-3-methyl-5-hydroxy-6-metoxy-1,4-benzoquinol methylase|nr:methyltransferase domain-containing protein [Bdellovibrionales bacterium]MBT3526989.1 methyltransferase domain-containing protein [Bdellovibrionales bacterium]